jgi:flagellin-like protein
MRKRRGISEIVSALVVVAVTVSGLGLYVVLSEQRILGDVKSVHDAIQTSEDQIKELVEFIDMFREDDEVRVFVHNYGFKNVTISSVFVNGTKNATDNVTLKDLNGLKSDSIPVGKTAEIVLNFTDDDDIPGIVKNIVIRTDSNKLIEIRNDTN